VRCSSSTGVLLQKWPKRQTEAAVGVSPSSEKGHFSACYSGRRRHRDFCNNVYFSVEIFPHGPVGDIPIAHISSRRRYTHFSGIWAFRNAELTRRYLP